jgi:5-methylcytosine-specific restriction endonuclease McrA
VRRAISLVYRGLAKIISPETYETHDFESWSDLSIRKEDPHIRTVSLSIRVPEVIVLLFYDSYPKKRIAFSRKNIYRRDHFTCQYCGKTAGSEELSIDHIKPRSLGGESTWTNCVLACLRCNVRKGNRSLEEAGMSLIRKPTKPKWAPYLTFTLGKMKQSWEKFISSRYWNTELKA